MENKEHLTLDKFDCIDAAITANQLYISLRPVRPVSRPVLLGNHSFDPGWKICIQSHSMKLCQTCCLQLQKLSYLRTKDQLLFLQLSQLFKVYSQLASLNLFHSLLQGQIMHVFQPGIIRRWWGKKVFYCLSIVCFEYLYCSSLVYKSYIFHTGPHAGSEV